MINIQVTMKVQNNPTVKMKVSPQTKKVINADEEIEKQNLSKRPAPEFKGKTPILANDRVLVHSDQTFECDEPNCKAVFGNAKSLNYHKARHRDRKIRCGICQTIFKSQEEKSKHLETFHPNLEDNPSANLLQCQKCKKESSSAFTLKRHIERAHQTRKYPCPHCGFEFAQMECLNQHLKHKHPEDGKESPKYPCHICGKIYLYNTDLRQHIRRVHRPPDENEQYKCNICKTIYYCKRTYRHHMSRHNPKYSCKTCNFYCPNQASYYRHLTTKSHKVAVGQVTPKSIKEARKIRMELNGMKKDELLKFCWTRVPKIILTRVDPKEVAIVERKTLEELNQMDKPELIKFCKRRVPKIILHRVDNTKNSLPVAKSEDRFKRRKSKVGSKFGARENSNFEEKKNMHCVYCRKRFFDLEKVKLHEKTCYKEKRYGTGNITCPVCKKEFKRRSKLAMHLTSHSKERPFKCQYCDTTYKTKGCRISHEMNIHFGFPRVVKKDRIFKCNHDGCDMQYRRRSNLKLHILSKHLGTRYPCTKCHKDYSRPDYLKIHYEVEHASYNSRNKGEMKDSLEELKKINMQKKRKTPRKDKTKYCEDNGSDSEESSSALSDIADKSWD